MLDLGQNIKAEIKGDKLIIEVDLSKRGGPSRSGKSITIATTSGNQKIVTEQGTVVIGLNIYTPKTL